MSARFRTVFAVLMIGGALFAAAASPGSAAGRPGSPGDFVGTWITWWEVEGENSACRRLLVAPENGSRLDGMWSAPGWNGLVHGTVGQTGEGLVWHGEWRGASSAGRFRLVLGGAGSASDRFQGTYTTTGGSARALAWNGVREVPGRTPRVPCGWEE
ncbi:MAG: hypothetical protein KY467_06625 [Gemmatimonadetes bacterium]|nr:hypothetical protein [Gemmatimonadota bacterium]